MAESITQDITLTARMELKTYTVTINSGKSNGESKTYKVPQGQNWSLPAYPFTTDAGKVFVNYTINGATKSVGNEIQVTSNLTIVSNLRVTEPIGKTCSLTYWIVDGGDLAIRLDSYEPELEGKELTYIFGGAGIAFSSTLVLNAANKGNRVVSMSGIHFSMTPTLNLRIDGFTQVTRSGYTSSSGSRVTYTCNK